MQNRSIKIPASNRQILNLAFRSRYNISFFQIFLFFQFKITFYNSHSCGILVSAQSLSAHCFQFLA